MAPINHPAADSLAFILLGLEGANHRRRAIEHRHRVAAVFRMAIYIHRLLTQQTIGLLADLVRGAVNDVQRARAAP
ncbi:MAG: hypothetical protein U1D25_00860 [Hydrogenophaga sp.]|nr:hypothetical protein [Hydrogenophaga sp.]